MFPQSSLDFERSQHTRAEMCGTKVAVQSSHNVPITLDYISLQDESIFENVCSDLN